MDFGAAWQRLLGRLKRADPPLTATRQPPAHDPVAASLRELLEDPAIPTAIRTELAAEFAAIERMLRRLEKGELHVAVFGRVSTGKSALCNALLGREAFPVGVLHGTTTEAGRQALGEGGTHGLVLIDTPGINELDGEAREELAFAVADVSDVVLFVVDGDLTREERSALETLAATRRPLLLVLNKADRYGAAERERLLDHLRTACAGLAACRTYGTESENQSVRGQIRDSLQADSGSIGQKLAQIWAAQADLQPVLHKSDRLLVQADNVLAVAALPAPRRRVRVDPAGHEHEELRSPPPDVEALRRRLLNVAAREGKQLAAINAGLYAGRLTDRVSRRIMDTRRELAHKLIRQYCLAKGVAVALNPIPVADLLAVAGLDVAMIVHLSRIYGLPLTRTESTRLVATISAQLAALMGAIWGVHLVASALKGVSVGLSTVVTAGVQGALAWYATVMIGRAAEAWLVQGKSWGDKGAKRAVREVVESLDRDSILREGRAEILQRLRKSTAAP